MAELGAYWVNVAVTAKGIKAQLDKEIGNPLKDTGGKAGDEAGKTFAQRFEAQTGKSLDRFGKGALIGAAALGVGLFKAAGAAGNLEAAIAANEQVLGDASSAVQDFGEHAIENVGLSERAALEAATSFGQLGKIIGLTGRPLADFSTGLVTAAADMAAFKDVPVQQALEDLQSGFAGSTEVLRKYGIFLDDAGLKQAYFRETGEKVTGTLTAQQRILATHSEIMRQGADMWGQAERESGGFARAQDNLKAALENASASIGASVLPAVTGLVTGLGHAVTAIGGVNDATGGMVGNLLAIGTAGLGAAGGLAVLIDKGSKARKAFEGMGTMSKRAVVGLGAVTVAITAGVIAYDALTSHSREVEAKTRAAADALGDATKQAWDLADAASAAAGEMDGLAIAQEAFGRAIVGTDDELEQAFGTIGIQIKDAGAALIEMAGDPVVALQRLGKEAGLSEDNIGLLTEVILRFASTSNDYATGSVDDLAASIYAIGEAGGMTADEARELAAELYPVADAIETVWDAANTRDLDSMAAELLNTAVAADESAEALIKQAEAQAGGSRNGEKAYEVYVKLQEIIADLPPVQREAALTALGWADGMGAAAAAIREVAAGAEGMPADMQAVNQIMSDLGDQFDEMVQQAKGYLDVIGGADWGRTAFEGAATGMSRFNEQHFGLARIMAESEAAVDQLADSFKNADGTINQSAVSFDLTTEAGRGAQSALEGVASALETKFVAAYDNANGSVDDFIASGAQIRAEFIEQALAAGIDADQVEALADKLGLTEGDYRARFELSGVEEAQLKLSLLDGSLELLPESVRLRIAALVADGEFVAAADLAQSELNKHPATIQAIADTAVAEAGIRDVTEQERVSTIIADALTTEAAQGLDVTAKERIADIIANAVTETADAGLDGTAAERRIADILANALTSEANSDLGLTAAQRTAIIQAIGSGITGVDDALNNAARNRTAYITVRRVDGGGYQYGPGAQVARALGGYIDRPEIGLYGEDGAEAILPLTKPWRMAELLSDPRILTPVLGALPLEPASASGGGAPSFDVRVYVGDREITDIVRTEFRQRDRRALAGSRHQ